MTSWGVGGRDGAAAVASNMSWRPLSTKRRSGSGCRRRTVDRLAVNALAAVLVGLRGVPYVT
jgi:hypothetical protein